MKTESILEIPKLREIKSMPFQLSKCENNWKKKFFPHGKTAQFGLLQKKEKQK